MCTKWRGQIREKYNDAYIFEKQVTKVVVKMMNNRVGINRPLAINMKRLYKEKSDEYLLKIKQYLKSVGYEDWEIYNPHPSSPHTRRVIEHLGLETGETFKGRVRSDAESLSKYTDHPWVALTFKYRFYYKHWSTYYEPLVNHYTTKDNWNAVFMAYQTNAKSGRFTYELFQTFPRMGESKKSDEKHEVRKCVVARKNHQLVCIDEEQEEVRLAASFANCKKMLQAFKKGEDIYRNTALRCWGKEFVDQSDEMKIICRKIFKDTVLGVIYGLGVDKLVYSLTVRLMDMVSKEAWKQLAINEEKAREILQFFHSEYPEIRDYMQKLIREIWHTGRIQLCLNSPYYHLIRHYNVPTELAYKGLNAIVQGSAAYVLKGAMLRCQKYIDDNKLNNHYKLIAVVHDELIFDIPIMNDKKEEYEHIMALKTNCEDHVTFRVPLIASVKIGPNWGEMKKYV